MIKKSVLWVVGAVLVLICSSPAFADQSKTYKEYFNEGVEALKNHDDQKALRCFKIAQVYDPSDAENNKYVADLEEQIANIESNSPKMPIGQMVVYQYYLKGGIESLSKNDKEGAIHYFRIAKIFNPYSSEVDRYLGDLGVNEIQVNENTPVQLVPPPKIVQAPLEQKPESSQQVQRQQIPLPQPRVIATTPVQSVTYVSVPKAQLPISDISLSQLKNIGQLRAKIQIEINSSLILDGKNIKRYLVVDEGYISVKNIDSDHVRIDTQRIGATFLHIWDENGRYTIYIEVVFPKAIVNASQAIITNNIQHSQPFLVTYTNDWSTYYSGKTFANLKRQSYNFNQTLAVTGETPYGFFDTSGSYTDFDAVSQFDTYTIGLSEIPLEGTSNFNLRGFDALRYMSPLTMPGSRLRGIFTDIDFWDDNLGLSFSHGQEQRPLGFISQSESQFSNAYIDAAKITLFPKSTTDQYSFNFATGYGADFEPYLSKHVYSIEGMHKFNKFLTLNAEEGRDDSHDSTLASLKWEDGNLRSGVNFRNIDKDYTDITTLPANQGETGGTWTADLETNNISFNSFVDAYQDHLNSNPAQPRALNYDVNEHLRANITPKYWADTNYNYVDTPGELSPSRSMQIDQRFSRSVSLWNSLKGTVFAGGGYQNSHSSDSNLSDYSRSDVIAGVEIPLTSQVSSFVNYEYDWLRQPFSGGTTNPSIINAGLEYQKQFTPNFSINNQIVYRDEMGVTGNNSFLSGERSVIVTSGFTYNPTADLSFFADANASMVLSHLSNPSYDDLGVHVGMRVTFGGATYWDPLGVISGVVFKDRDGSGKYSKSDEGVASVKIKVGDKVAMTDKNGHYQIQFRAKGVQVTPIMDTLPGGLIFSTPQYLNVQILQGRVVHADFGFITQTGIYGIVFVDKYKKGVPSDGDKFVGKVRIILDGKIIQKSDFHGAFYFRNVAPGKHTISIDINSIPLDMVPLVKLKNKIDVAEGTNYMFNIPVQIKQLNSQET